MARFEVAVRSAISFRNDDFARPAPRLADPPETVGIRFEERLFVWHYFPPTDDPDFGYEEWGPSVYVTVADDADSRLAADSMQRFLTALAFHFDESIDAVSYGGSGEIDAFHPFGLRARRAANWTLICRPPAEIAIRPEANLQLALAHYREGLNASSPFYRFLAFWNALDATFGVETDTMPRDDFLRNVGPRYAGRWDDRYAFPADPAEALERESRHAIAHVLRPQGRRTINPDHGADRARIDAEASWLRILVRVAIEQEYPAPVTVALEAE